jgi:hypothetical protein
MGDEADRINEEGLDAWLLHLTNDCGLLDMCQYCDEAFMKEVEKNGRSL